jgi:hypothetical protein
MRTATRLVWRVAGIAAFGATAALAVAFSGQGPAHVSLATASGPVPVCARSALLIRALPDRLEFTNSATGSCGLTGYPATATQDAVLAGHVASPVLTVTLRHGTTAYAALVVSDRGCRHPEMIGVLGVRLPGDSAYSYVDYRTRACSVRVGAFQPVH